MTYQEAAVLLGSTPDAVRVRARRSHWRRQRGNDGKTLILVPADLGEHARVLAPEQGGHAAIRSPERPGEQSGQSEQPVELRLVLEMLRDQAPDHRRERRDSEERERTLRAEVERLRGRATEAETAALEAWRTAAELARRLVATEGTGFTAPPAPSRRGWLARLLG